MLEAFALTDPGRVRTSNQDTFRVDPEIGLYLLADGMGGAKGGATASNLAADAVTAILKASPHRDAAALIGAVEEANCRVLAEATRDPLLEGMGTTMVVAIETKPNDIAIASVGDSRAYLLRKGVLRAITQDQSWVQEVGRPMGIDEENLRIHPMRHVLTMAVGIASAVRILYYAVELAPDDILLLSSDGLHGVVAESDIKDMLSTPGLSLEAMCNRLVEAANTAGSPDNVTVVVIRSV